MTGPADQRDPLPAGTVRLGQIAGIDVVVQASWLLVALLIAVGMAPRISSVAPGLGWLTYVAGLAFAVLLYLSVLLHEASHAIAARHYGLTVRSISIHFLGGATQLESEAPSARAELVIAVVGPLTSLAVGGVSLGLAFVTPDGLVGLAVDALATTNLVVGVLNLVPGLPLDGGRVLRAVLWGLGTGPDRATVVAAWGGRVAAVLVVAWPVFVVIVLQRPPDVVDMVVAVMIGVFLWGGATASLVHARMRRRLPGLAARPLARRLLEVPEDLPVSEAVRRAQDARAGGIATIATTGGVVGLVDERALQAMPVERRPWVPTSSLARAVEPGMRISADLVGEDLIRAITEHPASEYLLLDPDGEVFGVLSVADVERAFAAVRQGRPAPEEETGR
ncbi:site-2 protease family protein [Nocardioides mangrovicus]|uniref:Zinc metalloprotease n=1 Tax=Nocardioides mangrovicus TaxID=2478913 RepID=A0A3L8NZU1_9ACTN|nr:site-2 protease family protein [Nocardioides mangrovicus]RLV48710.1 site-2 protease family protein [Nocardioides mangrovicus]